MLAKLGPRKGAKVTVQPVGRDIAWGQEVGDKLRRVRESAGITQRELEKRSGVSRATIQNYEAGRVLDDPPVRILTALAVGLGVDMTELLPDNYMGRTALGIIQRMEADRGKDLARLQAIAGPSSRRSSIESNDPADSLSAALRRPRKRIKRSGGTSKTCLTQTALEQPQHVLAQAA
jgi:transcriptional regulator with XRE-family HTH domain